MIFLSLEDFIFSKTYLTHFVLLFLLLLLLLLLLLFKFKFKFKLKFSGTLLSAFPFDAFAIANKSTSIVWSARVAPNTTWSAVTYVDSSKGNCSVSANAIQSVVATLNGDQVELTCHRVTSRKGFDCVGFASVLLDERRAAILIDFDRQVDFVSGKAAFFSDDELIGRGGDLSAGDVLARQATSATNVSSIVVEALARTGTARSRWFGVSVFWSSSHGQSRTLKAKSIDTVVVAKSNAVEETVGNSTLTTIHYTVERGKHVLVRFPALEAIATFEINRNLTDIRAGFDGLQCAMDLFCIVPMTPVKQYAYANDTTKPFIVHVPPQNVSVTITVRFEPKHILCDPIITCHGNGRCPADKSGSHRCDCIEGFGFAFEQPFCEKKRAGVRFDFFISSSSFFCQKCKK